MPTNLESQILSLLFASGREMRLKELVKFTEVKEVEVKEALQNLIKKVEDDERGIVVIKNGSKYKVVSNPKNAEVIQRMLQDERSGDLTPASLEALTVIAYRGPMTQFELEQIRGVSCTMILRNLLIKGLIVKEGKNQAGDPLYQISFDFLEYLGVSDVKDLPKYQDLHHDKNLVEFLERREAN